MRVVLFAAAALVLGCNASLAQVSTMGTTAMGLSSTPGTILSSPLNGPSPFSAISQPGTPDTTLAPVPLASDPSTPGTVVTCSTPTGQIGPATPTVPVTSTSVMAATIATTPLGMGTPTVPSAASNATAASSTVPFALSAQPATSFLSTLPGSTVPAASMAATSALSAPSIAAPAAAPSLAPATVATSTAGNTATTMPSTTTPSSTAMMSGTALGTIPTPVVASATGTISPVPPLGSPSTTVCSSMPGGPPTNGAALPLSTPQIPASLPLGTIEPAVAGLAGTSIDPNMAPNPTMAVMPTPNTSACAESVTMNLATPGMMTPANATGAPATPGVSPPMTPSGC